MISDVNQVCIEVDVIGEELDQYVAFSTFMAGRNYPDDDAIAHVSKAGNRTRTFEKTGYNLSYNST